MSARSSSSALQLRLAIGGRFGPVRPARAEHPGHGRRGGRQQQGPPSALAPANPSRMPAVAMIPSFRAARLQVRHDLRSRRYSPARSAASFAPSAARCGPSRRPSITAGGGLSSSSLAPFRGRGNSRAAARERGTGSHSATSRNLPRPPLPACSARSPSPLKGRGASAAPDRPETAPGHAKPARGRSRFPSGTAFR